MELSVVHQVALGGFFIALIFGAVANKTHFCAMGAVSDWVLMNHTGRLRAWFLAIGVAIIGTQLLSLQGSIPLSQSIYLTPNFGWLGHIVGGLVFGIGMTLAGGCGQRTLVRVGAGSLKSLVVLLVLAISAYASLRGVLALVRIDGIEPTNIHLARHGLADQSVLSLLHTGLGLPQSPYTQALLGLGIGLGFVVFAFAQRDFRRQGNNLLSGLTVGLCVVAGWVITGKLGADEFEPVPVESLTFVAPVGDSLQYIMTYTGSTIKFGIAAVGGMVLGSFLYSLLTRRLRLESFSTQADLVNHLLGGALMGFGGVLALGCTIGQGVTGMSTLALGAFLSLSSIILGAALTMKVQYYRLDNVPFRRALYRALADLRLLPRTK